MTKGTSMNLRKRLLLLLAALVLPIALVSAGGAQAVPSAKTAFQVAGSGTGVGAATVIDTRQVGTTTISHITAPVEFTGDITATGTELFTAIVDAGGVHYHGYGVFAGTVGDRSGTFEYHFTGTAAGGRITFDSGMDQLEGMQGHIRWTTTTGAGFTYAGGVRFPS
jgi:Protein of unknown function (DUF3224)